MTRWLAHGITLVVMITLAGCVSSPPRMPAEDIGFTRATQVGGDGQSVDHAPRWNRAIASESRC